jgi:hypothetical protein
MLCLSGPTIRTLGQGIKNIGQNPVHIGHNIDIGNPQNPKPTFHAKQCILSNVILAIMRVTVNLNNQPLGWTEKVKNALFADFLASELVSAKLRLGKIMPQTLFCLCWLPTHFLRTFLQERFFSQSTPLIQHPT